MTDNMIREPARDVRVCHECDICVIGGSCTGVFAAVRAARLGARVAIVEQLAIFGGMATAALVNHWHSLLDAHGQERIIGGLTGEVVERLRKRNAIKEISPVERTQFILNSAELALELDCLVQEAKIRPFLSTRFSVPICEDRSVRAIVIEDKSGRRAIRARVFIDASGDGDLIRRMGLRAVQHDKLQPVSLQVLAAGVRQIQEKHPGISIWNEVRDLAAAQGHPTSKPWISPVAEMSLVHNIFGARLNGVDASDPDQLTEALIEGRRLAGTFMNVLRERFGHAAPELAVIALPHALGVRETWHACCQHRLTEEELLSGRQFPDAIANGTYPVDIHHPGGTLLRYLDGREEIVTPSGERTWQRWRSESEPTPRCYHIPFGSLVPQDTDNVVVAGRVIDAERGAFGGVRVMVNCNQMGEAAGVAAWLAAHGDGVVPDVDPHRLRKTLAVGGSIVV